MILCNHCIKVFKQRVLAFFIKKEKLMTLTILSHFLAKYQRLLKMFKRLMLRLLNNSVFLHDHNNIVGAFLFALVMNTITSC